MEKGPTGGPTVGELGKISDVFFPIMVQTFSFEGVCGVLRPKQLEAGCYFCLQRELENQFAPDGRIPLSPGPGATMSNGRTRSDLVFFLPGFRNGGCQLRVVGSCIPRGRICPSPQA